MERWRDINSWRKLSQIQNENEKYIDKGREETSERERKKERERERQAKRETYQQFEKKRKS